MRRNFPSLIALISMMLALAACAGAAGDFIRGYASGRSFALSNYDMAALTPRQRGAVVFTLSDFGALNTDTLETHAIPWRLAATALVLRDVRLHGGEVSAARIRPIMTRFGFLYPEVVANWPEHLPPPPRALEAPQGMSLGVVERNTPRVTLTTANLACAACHAGHTFDASGAPQPQQMWLGAPNSSLNLELYVQEVYAAIRDMNGREDETLRTIRVVFPDTSDAEMDTLRRFVMPRLKTRMAALAQQGDRPLPFLNGAPGTTNGVAALRMRFGLLGDDSYTHVRAFTSIPDLGARGFRTALLYDGAYSPPGEAAQRAMRETDVTQAHLDRLATVTAFFTVPSMGVRPDRVAGQIGEARDVYAFLYDYKPPRFPGRIDARLAAQGRDLYADACASCHGSYDRSITAPRLLSFPNWIGAFDTNAARAEAFTPEAAAAVNASAYRERIVAHATGQYAAPLLSGLWMSAPYLHNGSVPTLWHLMHSEQRPARFEVGGHRLDYRHVGIDGVLNAEGDYVYPRGYAPWSEPSLIDTRALGFGNQGHAPPFNTMSETQKRALLEYLKLL